MNLTTTITTTMSSFELLDFVNIARVEFGETAIRRNDFNNRCKDELDGDHYEINVVKNQNGTESESIEMTRDQCMFILMRESKGVRRKVTAQINAISSEPKFDPATLTRIDILKLAMESEEGRIKAESERDHAIATKSQIGSKREATAMANVAKANKEVTRLMDRLGFNAKHATIKAVESSINRSFGPQGWRPLSAWCKSHGLSAVDVPDPLYGSVKSWPADAWGEVYDVDLSTLFASKEAA